jgi:hypothetical protein
MLRSAFVATSYDPKQISLFGAYQVTIGRIAAGSGEFPVILGVGSWMLGV